MTTTMSRFRYEAETVEGSNIRGMIQAPSVSAARNQLAVQGMRVTRIAERKRFAEIEVTKQRVPLVEIMHFSRQMGTFMRAGVPLPESLENLRQDTTNKRFVGVLSDILERVSSGRSVADAIAVHDDVFPAYFIAMLGSAEYTGRLDEAFDQLHTYLKRDLELKDMGRLIPGHGGLLDRLDSLLLTVPVVYLILSVLQPA